MQIGEHTEQFSDKDFDEQVLASDQPVLVDFWAEWCGPCHMIAPIMDEVAVEYKDRVRVGKLNVDENPSVAAKYGIRSIPSILLFKGGRGEPADCWRRSQSTTHVHVGPDTITQN